MKTAVKIWLIAAGVLVLLGCALFVGAMAVNHWDVSLLDTARYETRTIEVKEAFQSVCIRSETEDVDFAVSADGSCKVVCYEPEKVQLTAAVENGTLRIERADAGKWYDSITLFSFDSPKITVYLPQGEYAALSIEESTGDVVIPKDFAFGSVDVSVSTGDVACAASASGQITITTSTGKIRLEDLSAGALALSVSTGRVEASSVECSGPLSVNVSTGKAILTDVSCRSLSSAGSTGDVTLKNVTAAEKLAIKRSTGDVKFDRCDAGELEITTDTGSVTGSLRTEKIFFACSDTGRVRVPESLTGGKCKITTDTGKIEIEIKN